MSVFLSLCFMCSSSNDVDCRGDGVVDKFHFNFRLNEFCFPLSRAFRLHNLPIKLNLSLFFSLEREGEREKERSKFKLIVQSVNRTRKFTTLFYFSSQFFFDILRVTRNPDSMKIDNSHAALCSIVLDRL